MKSKKTTTRTRKSTKNVSIPENDGSFETSTPPEIVLDVLKNGILRAKETIADFQRRIYTDGDMTGHQRMRLYGVKVRKYGFITTAAGLVRARPEFIPSHFSLDNMTKTLRILDQTRDLTALLEQLLRTVGDLQLKTSDTAYRDGLRIYGSLREQSRGRVPGAEDLLEQLSSFFAHRRRRSDDAEPTLRELELEARHLIHGTADGEMVIKHESPRMIGGVHEVVENVGKRGRRGAEIKVKEEES